MAVNAGAGGPKAHHLYTILVPVSGTAASLEAVSIACTLAKARKGVVILVHIIEVARKLPLDANLEADARKGEQVLRKAEEVARKVDVQVSGELLQAREPGVAIVEEANDRHADLIILGIGGRRHGGADLGVTAAHVLRVASAQVMILRQPAGAQAQTHGHAVAQAG